MLKATNIIAFAGYALLAFVVGYTFPGGVLNFEDNAAWLVAAFFATSFGLAIIATEKTRSVDDVDIAVPAVQQQPATEEASADDLPAVEAGDAPAAAPVEGDLPTGDIPEA